jgi:hypothetical protein
VLQVERTIKSATEKSNRCGENVFGWRVKSLGSNKARQKIPKRMVRGRAVWRNQPGGKSPEFIVNTDLAIKATSDHSGQTIANDGSDAQFW